MNDLLEYLLTALDHFLEPQMTLYRFLSVQFGDAESTLISVFTVVAIVTEIFWGINLFLNAAERGGFSPALGSILQTLLGSREGCFVLLAIGLFLLVPFVNAINLVGSLVVALWSVITAQICLFAFLSAAFSLGRSVYYRASAFLVTFLIAYLLAILIRLSHIEVVFSAIIVLLSGVTLYHKLSEIQQFSLLTCLSLTALCLVFNLIAGYYIELIATAASSNIVAGLLPHSFWLIFVVGWIYEYLRYSGRLRFR